MIIGIIFLLLSIAVAVGTWWYVKMLEARPMAGRSGRDLQAGNRVMFSMQKGRKNDLAVQDLWEVEEIRNGLIIFKGGWYRALLKIGPIDYHIMNDNEQYAIESVLMSCAMALGFQIQLFSTTELVDTQNCAQSIRTFIESRENIPETMAEYGLSMYSFLTSLMQNRSVHNHSRYIAVSYHTSGGIDRARDELERRAQVMINNLRRAKITTEMLSSEQLLDVVARFGNRGRVIKPSEAVSEGTMDLYAVGLREVVADVFPEP